MKFLRQRTGFSVFLMLVFGVFLTACGGGGSGGVGDGSGSSGLNLPASFVAQANGSISRKTIGNVTLEADVDTLEEGSTVLVNEREYNGGTPKYNLWVASKVYSFSVKNKNNVEIFSSVEPLELTLNNNMPDAAKIFIGSRKANSSEPWSYSPADNRGNGNVKGSLAGRFAVAGRLEIDVFKFDMEYALFGLKQEHLNAMNSYILEMSDDLEPKVLAVNSVTGAYQGDLNLKLKVYGSNVDKLVTKGSSNLVVRLYYQNNNPNYIDNLIIGDAIYSSSANLAGVGKTYTHTAEIKNISAITNFGTDEAHINLYLAIKDKKLSEFPRDFCVELAINGSENSLPYSIWEEESIDIR